MPHNLKTKIIGFLKLVRWFHEVAVILPFLCLYFVVDHFANIYKIDCNFNAFNLAILCFAIQLLIAAGCVLNDIADRHIDEINKPETRIIGRIISLQAAWIMFISLSVILLGVSIYISLNLFSEWTWICLGVYLSSFAYDYYFKRSPLMGNILMALLTGFIPLVLLFFAKECIYQIPDKRSLILIYLYAIWPFLIIVPRELSLDISDMEGDLKDGCKTLPIVIGIKKSKIVVAVFILLIVLLSFPMQYFYHYLISVLIPCDIMFIIYLYKLKSVKERIEYIRIGRFLWFIMLFGLAGFAVVSVI